MRQEGQVCFVSRIKWKNVEKIKRQKTLKNMRQNKPVPFVSKRGVR